MGVVLHKCYCHPQTRRSMNETVIPDGQLVGLSLRFCVDDMIRRLVCFERVEAIIADTCCRNRFEWESHVMLPGIHGWWSDPTRARQIVDRLIAEDLVHQPLLDGDEHPGFEPGHHWIPTPI